MRVAPERAIYHQIPSKHNFCRSWVVHIQNEQSLTAQGAADILQYLQLPDRSRTTTITFAKMTDPVRYDYQQYRAIFDSMTGLRQARMETSGQSQLNVANSSVGE